MSPGESKTDSEVNKDIFAITKGNECRIFTYDEAIDLTGDIGCYSIGLLLFMGFCTFATVVEMYGFSVIVNGAACDLGLDLKQISILLSMCFIGSSITAYPWGFYSDTYGRRRSMMIALWFGFIFSTLTAFSPNWIVMAAFKLFSTCFCSSLTSLSYTLLGESCSSKMRDSFMLIMTTFINWSMLIYVVVAYFVLRMDFVYDLSYITFTPWRLLALVLALPLGVGALGTHFIYESPKFLLNAGREKEALRNLTKIWERNNKKGGVYPVKKLVLNEDGNKTKKDVPFLESVFSHIVPLFKPPLLWNSLLLYYSIFVIYSTNTGYFVWFPFIVNKFFAGLDSLNNNETGLCKIILSTNNETTTNKDCTSNVDIKLIWAGLAEGVLMMVLVVIISKLSHKKKSLQIGILSVSGVSAILSALIKHNITSAVMYIGILINDLCIGIVFSYCVDLFPTSYRGMASCMATLVARASSLVGVDVVGAFILTFCEEQFYISGVLLISAAALSTFLPPDKKRKSDNDKP